MHDKEREELDNAQIAEIVDQLDVNIKKCHSLKAQFYNISDDHLHKWLSVLSGRIGK